MNMVVGTSHPYLDVQIRHAIVAPHWLQLAFLHLLQSSGEPAQHRPGKNSIAMLHDSCMPRDNACAKRTGEGVQAAGRRRQGNPSPTDLSMADFGTSPR